ncbi:MAG: hypothetical protein ACFFC7_24150 [Candidatus Hermodarchaeota archaeon]
MTSDRAADWRSIRRCRDRFNVGHISMPWGWSIRGLPRVIHSTSLRL